MIIHNARQDAREIFVTIDHDSVIDKAEKTLDWKMGTWLYASSKRKGDRNMADFAIIDDPKFPKSEQNKMETFNIRWVRPNGRRNGTNRATMKEALALAKKAKANGNNDVQILRQWFAGYLI